jgi:phage tail sheath gpL-like
MAKLTVDEIIELGKISIPLASEYQAKGSLFGPRKATAAPQTIALVTDAVQWQWEAFPDTVLAGAKATVTIEDIGATGNSIDIAVEDPLYGFILLGGAVKNQDMISPEDLAQAIVTSINQNEYGYTATSQGGVVTITARPDTGTQLNGVPLKINISTGNGVEISTQDLDPIITQNSLNLIIE